MNKAEDLVAQYQKEARRIIYTTQEAWNETISGRCSSYTKCVSSHSIIFSCSCIYATPIAFS